MPAAVVGDNGSVTPVPDKPTEKKLLWDLAGVIDPVTAQEIEDSLENFSRTTSNQILVMTVTSIGGADISEYATQLGRDWGVGHEGDNNGVVILIKVKTENEKGNAFIATGYGVEAVLPDVLCKRIIEKEKPEGITCVMWTGSSATALRSVPAGNTVASPRHGTPFALALVFVMCS